MKLSPRLCCIVVAVAAFLPAAAQTEFQPSVAVEAAYSDNIEYSGTAASSDTAYRLALELPVARTWRRGSLQFRYSPRRIEFQDASALDHTDHVAGFSLSSELSRKSRLTFDSSFSRAQTQGDFISLEDPGIVLTERTTRDRLDASLSYGLQFGPRWSWNLNAGAGTVSNEPISGFGGGLGGVTLEDRDHTELSTGLGRQVSEKTVVGFDLRFEQNRLDVSGDEDVHAADISISHQVDRNNSLTLAIGGFSTSSEVLGEDDRSGVFLMLNYDRVFRRVGMALFAGHRPSAGGNLLGTATDTNVGLSVAGLRSQKILWDLSTALARRDPADPGAAELDSIGLFGGLTWMVHRDVGLRLAASSTNQSSDATSLDTDVFNASLGVVWFPRGRQQGRTGNE